jgi:hypothetical protein
VAAGGLKLTRFHTTALCADLKWGGWGYGMRMILPWVWPEASARFAAAASASG